MNTGERVTIKALIKDHLLKLLQATGSKTLTATIMGVSRRTVTRWCEEFGIREEWRSDSPDDAGSGATPTA
jgi:hypothetical protein